LLSFTRNRQPVRRPVAARRLIDESLRSMDHLFRQTAVELVLDVPEDAEVAVDAELVKQVFMNLILNAVQAMEEGGGTLTVTAGEAVDEGRSFVRFRFRDTGRGMTEDVRRRVFNPFFSTKDRGTGLGLALVHNIVRAHGGRVDVDSAPGRGAVLTVLLPKE
jgi:signal transduction histidine kinase